VQGVADDEVAAHSLLGPRLSLQDAPQVSPAGLHGHEQPVDTRSVAEWKARPSMSPSVSPNNEKKPRPDEQTPIAQQVTPGLVSDITNRIQARLAKRNDPEDEATDDSEMDGVARKRPSALVMKVMKRPSGPKVMKVMMVKKRPSGPNKTKEGGKGNDSEGKLHFRSGFCPPRKIGAVTIFTDLPNRKWRVKPCKGSRETKQFSFATREREQWDMVVKHVKTLL
jgi:hypothetical protein